MNTFATVASILVGSALAHRAMPRVVRVSQGAVGVLAVIGLRYSIFYFTGY